MPSLPIMSATDAYAATLVALAANERIKQYLVQVNNAVLAGRFSIVCDITHQFGFASRDDLEAAIIFFRCYGYEVSPNDACTKFTISWKRAGNND